MAKRSISKHEGIKSWLTSCNFFVIVLTVHVTAVARAALSGDSASIPDSLDTSLKAQVAGCQFEPMNNNFRLNYTAGKVHAFVYSATPRKCALLLGSTLKRGIMSTYAGRDGLGSEGSCIALLALRRFILEHIPGDDSIAVSSLARSKIIVGCDIPG